MRLNRLYSNRASEFPAIDFNGGLSAILAEIRVPENRLLDTHNLGKTTVGELIDFCLLKQKSRQFFLFQHQELFSEYVFYLELELPGSRWLTIARPVNPGSRINFLRSEAPVADAGTVPTESWDHIGVPFDRAKVLLDGYLEIGTLRPWGFRKLIGYLIRSQADYLDVFQLRKFSGKHQEWKPFVAHLLGLESQPVIDLYGKREELAQATAHLNSLTQEWGAGGEDPSVLDGLISVKRRDVDARISTLDSFNFGAEDSRVTTDLVDEIEARISGLNEERYRSSQVEKRLAESLEEDNILFRPEDAETLFRDAGILLGNQVQRNYQQLIEFNRAITNERRQALLGQLAQVKERLLGIDRDLERLNRQRARSLEYLRESETITKYKEISQELTVLRADLNTLEARRSAALRLAELRRQQRTLSEECGQLETVVEQEIESASGDEQSTFGRMRRYFTEIVFEVLGQNAILAIKMNNAGGLDFVAEFVGDFGTATSEDRGTSYRKLLCIAFDLAFLRTYLDMPFPRFVYHDGALEQLEPRKRENLIRVFREYAEYGIQPVISALDSDLPAPLDAGPSTLSSTDVVLTLHDEGVDGRLFRTVSW